MDIFASFNEVTGHQINIFVSFTKVNVHKKMFKLVDIFCRSSFDTQGLRLDLQISFAKKYLTCGILNWFFIKIIFLTNSILKSIESKLLSYDKKQTFYLKVLRPILILIDNEYFYMAKII